MTGTVLLAALTGLSAAPAPAADGLAMRVRPIVAHRGLPHAFHDQAVESIRATAPQARFVERLRAETLGAITYAVVAWKQDARATHVNVDAAVVSGRRAWAFELSAPVAGYPAARAGLLERMQALASRPPPRAEVTLQASGRPVPLGDAADLLWDVETLVASCSFVTPLPAIPPGSALDLSVRYDEPRVLGLAPRPLEAASVEEDIVVDAIRIVADPARNTGWPLESVRHRGGEVGLAKCDGAAALRVMCRPELRPFAPATVASGCRLVAR
jgi:hypothetical protein